MNEGKNINSDSLITKGPVSCDGNRVVGFWHSLGFSPISNVLYV